MTWEKLTFGPDTVCDFLNNAKLLGPFPLSGLPLGGKTLIFSAPVATVTLPGEDGSNITLADLMAALRAQVPGLRVMMRPAAQQTATSSMRAFSLYRDGGLKLAKHGTANEAIGLSTEDETVIKSPFTSDSVKSVSRVSPVEYEVLLTGADSARVNAG